MKVCGKILYWAQFLLMEGTELDLDEQKIYNFERGSP